MLTESDLTAPEAADWAARRTALVNAGAGSQQLQNELRNHLLRCEAQRKPRHLKAIPAGAFITSGKKWSAPESVRYFSQKIDERKAEDARVEAERDPNFLRKEISAEHRRLSAEGGDPGKLQALLKKKRSA